ncbi:MAG: thioredoxin family protein [Nannocystis sp.]|nr:thioredoxin family protein [Nannocystis sp.]
MSCPCSPAGQPSRRQRHHQRHHQRRRLRQLRRWQRRSWCPRSSTSRPSRRSTTSRPTATLFEQALAQAREQNKRVLVTIGGNWCSWCHKLHLLFRRDPAIGARLRAIVRGAQARHGRPRVDRHTARPKPEGRCALPLRPRCDRRGARAPGDRLARARPASRPRQGAGIPRGPGGRLSRGRVMARTRPKVRMTAPIIDLPLS